MFNRLSVAWNYVQKWYWEHGGEEIDPLGRFRGPHPEPWRRPIGYPVPWKAATLELVRLIQARELGRILPEGAQKKAVVQSASLALDASIDDLLCPYPRFEWPIPYPPFERPIPRPWPWPGPPPWVWEIASELTAIAHSADGSSLREQLIEVASQLVTRGNVVTKQA